MNKLQKAIKHFNLINHHRFLVFKLCCKIGEPFRGFVHDLSKYSWTEFGESIKYYVGTHSPITEAKKNKGYSESWIHHKGRNKHHVEYWYDKNAPDSTPVMPYKYAAEMICDKLAAGNKGKDWTKEYPLSYWEKEREIVNINDKIKNFVTEVMIQVSQKGIDKTLTKKNIKVLYNKNVCLY